MGFQVNDLGGTALGLSLVTVLSGVFAPMFLRVDVPWAQCIGWVLAGVVALCAIVAIGLIAIVAYTGIQNRSQSSKTIYVK